MEQAVARQKCGVQSPDYGIGAAIHVRKKPGVQRHCVTAVFGMVSELKSAQLERMQAGNIGV
jgi:hypothetical protein